MEALLLAVGLAVVVALAWGSWQLRERRRRELALMARQLGFEFSPRDPFGCLGLPFHLLSRGDGRGVENVLWGVWQGVPVRVFDYWYQEEEGSERNRSRQRFSCAVTEIDAACPPLRLERENPMTRLADHLALHDIEFESEAFNRTFEVRARDRKFAHDLLDARMMAWLLSVDGGFSFEVAGRWLLCYSRRRRPMDLVPLLGNLKGFRDYVPRVVPEVYRVGTGG